MHMIECRGSLLFYAFATAAVVDFVFKLFAAATVADLVADLVFEVFKKLIATILLEWICSTAKSCAKSREHIGRKIRVVANLLFRPRSPEIIRNKPNVPVHQQFTQFGTCDSVLVNICNQMLVGCHAMMTVHREFTQTINDVVLEFNDSIFIRSNIQSCELH